MVTTTAAEDNASEAETAGRSSISNSETSSIASSALSEDDDEDNAVFMDGMRTRGAATGNGAGNGAPEVNGVEGRRLRSQSESAEQEFNGPLSPRTRASAAKQMRHSGDLDEEVSFNDPLSLDDLKQEVLCNGDSSSSHLPHYQRPMPASKKKRKSSDEKFLEDNSDYYGIQVLPNKLRSSEPFHNTFLDFLQQANVESKPDVGSSSSLQQRRKQRHKSATDVSPTAAADDDDHKSSLRRRQRILSTNGVGNHHHPSSSKDDDKTVENKRLLRVDVERIKLDGSKASNLDNTSDSDDGGDEDEAQTRRSRKSARNKLSRTASGNGSTTSSPSPKRLRRARSELDKLLEAGSSSFHFETARQASSRMVENGLGPIHVDVSENSNSSHEDHVNAKVSTTRRRQQEVVEDVEDDEEEEDEEEEEEEKPVKRGRGRQKKVVVKEVKKLKIKKKGIKKTDGRRGCFRRPLLTQADLLDGPVIIPSKDELLAKNKKKLPAPKKGVPLRQREFFPKELFDGLERRLKDVDGECVDVDDMVFSFERTPINEGWFQTYSRQDQGDEILFFPETKWFPLPYEMPNTTFYPSKPGLKKRQLLLESSLNSSVNPSGTATPEESPTPSRKMSSRRDPLPPPPKTLRRLQKSLLERKDSKASSTDSDCSSMQRRSGNSSSILDRLGPRTCLSLANDFSRKSPRCHASTKALLTSAHSTEDEDVDVDENNPLNNPFLLDECSNDSTASYRARRFKAETPAQLIKLASTLDGILTADDPLLVTDREDEPDAPKERLLLMQRKKRRRRSSSGKQHHSKQQPTLPEDPMDRLVAANVDPVLLDCLEDELPSVTIDEEVPGSHPLELIATFEQCQSMAKCVTARWARTKSFQADAAAAAAAASSPHPTAANPAAELPRRKRSAAAADDDNDDSSSEYATSNCETASSGGDASSGSGSNRMRKRRKRNLTGFPTVKRKKRKSLLNDVLTRASGRSLRDFGKKEEEDSEAEEITTSPRKSAVARRRKLRVPVRKGRPRKYKEPESDEEEEEEDEVEEEAEEEEDNEAEEEDEDDEEEEEDEDEDDEDEEEEEEDSEEEEEDPPVLIARPRRNKKSLRNSAVALKTKRVAALKKRSSKRVRRARN